LVLGPGQFKAFAHIGVLEELTKNKIPVSGIVGLEWGALPAALFSTRGLPYDVEWQMSKIKEDEILHRGFITSAIKARSPGDFQPFIQATFPNNRIEDAKIPFGCPTFELERHQTVWVQRGLYSAGLHSCLLHPPLWKSSQYVAGAAHLKEAADWLRSRGANVIIFVNVLGVSPAATAYKLEPDEREIWSLISQSLAKQYGFVDYVISVNLSDYSYLDFGHRRQMQQRGAESVQKSLRQLSAKFGL
jgi:NTE family protein